MGSYHDATFELLGTQLKVAEVAVREVESAERRLGLQIPRSLREWYCLEDAVSTLLHHSNGDPPIPVTQFEMTESSVGPLLPIRRENQGVCIWGVQLNGLDDPPVFVNVDSSGWQLLANGFSTYVFTCVWDYRIVLGQCGLVQAQNEPLSAQALEALSVSCKTQPETYGWPGSIQHRFAGDSFGILIWTTENYSADWFVGAPDARSLESALRKVWSLDGVGSNFYDCSPLGQEVLKQVRTAA